MRKRIKAYEEISPVEVLLQIDAMGLKRYKKTTKRDPEEREILLRLGLKKIKDREENDFIAVGYRRRKLKI
ncbi:MAG: hypothetical protein AB1390_00010 [Nitrospirota bacterium]